VANLFTPKLKVTLLEAGGLNVAAPLAVNELLAVNAPVAVKALLTVVVPVFLPMLIVVALFPMFKAVMAVLKMEAVPVSVEVICGLVPFRAKLPFDVIAPVKVEAPSTVSVPLAWIFPVVEIETPEPPPV
jgi:hypothetical protein